jgi:hypothetical protein
MTRALKHRSLAPPPAGAGRIRVGIERLALHGFNRAEAHRVAAAMEAELARLASRPGQAFVAANLAAGAPVHYQPSRDPEATGRAAARALWTGITRAEGQSP